MPAIMYHKPALSTCFKRRAASLAVAAIILTLVRNAYADDAINLGTVNSSAEAPNSTSASQLFGTPTEINVEQTPEQQSRNLQLFNSNADQAETEITTGKMESLPPSSSFTQALAGLPNVVIQNNGDSMTGDNIYINGLNKSLINFTLDSVPLNDNNSSTLYTNEFIPVPLVSGIQYYPGASSSAITGLAAFGGSVQTYSKNPGPDFYVEPIVGAGSFGKYDYGALFNTGILGENSGAPTSAYIYADKIHSDGYFQNNQADQKQLVFKSLTQLGKATLTLFYSRNDENFTNYSACSAAQIAQFGNSCNQLSNQITTSTGLANTNYAPYNYNNYLDSIAYLKFDTKLGDNIGFSNQLYRYDGNGYGAGAYNSAQNLLQPNGVYGSVPVPAGGLLLNNGYNITHRWGDIAKMLIPLGSTTAEVGLWYDHNYTDHDNRFFNSTNNAALGSSYRELVITDTTEPYVDFTYKFSSDLSLIWGAKYLYSTRNFINQVTQAEDAQTGSSYAYQFNSSFKDILPSLGLNYKITPSWDVYANYTKNDNPPGVNQYYIGTYNPGLNPEEAGTYDVGSTWKLGSWTSSIDVFRLDFSNYILSTTVPLGSSFVTELSNAGSATNEGVAWQNNLTLDRNWSSYANFGLLHARLDSLNQPFPDAPENTESAGVVYRDDALRAQLSVTRVASSYNSIGNSVGSSTTSLILPSNSMINFNIRYKLRYAPMDSNLGFKDATVALYVNNLLNATYITAYSGSATAPNDYLNLPRNYYVSLNARF